MKFRKKPVVIEATQWFKNGDHPDDYAHDTQGLENGAPRTFTGEERKARDWEGEVVRRYRHPSHSGDKECPQCGAKMRDHGWIDTLEGGHIVCPGDWIITGVKGEHYPCKPDVFGATYISEEIKMNARQLIEKLSAELNTADIDNILAVLRDGEALSYLGLDDDDQEVVEEAYDLLSGLRFK